MKKGSAKLRDAAIAVELGRPVTAVANPCNDCAWPALPAYVLLPGGAHNVLQLCDACMHHRRGRVRFDYIEIVRELPGDRVKPKL